MFQYNEDTREYWFSPAALEIGVSKSDFKMVGIVLGLVCTSERLRMSVRSHMALF